MPLPCVVLPLAPVLFAIVPPVPAPPVPVTCRPPAVPVVSTMMPLLVPPLDEMLWNVTSLAPIVVLAMLSPVPVPEVIVLPAPVAVTVPPPVAVNPAVLLALVLIASVPVKPIVAPVLP